MTYSPILAILLEQRAQDPNGGWSLIEDLMRQAHMTQAAVIAGLKQIVAHRKLEVIMGNGVFSHRYRLDPQEPSASPYLDIAPPIESMGAPPVMALPPQAQAPSPDTPRAAPQATAPIPLPPPTKPAATAKMKKSAPATALKTRQPKARVTASLEDAMRVGQQSIEQHLSHRKSHQ